MRRIVTLTALPEYVGVDYRQSVLAAGLSLEYAPLARFDAAH